MWNNQKIPEGWSVKKLGNECSTFSGGTPSVKNASFYDGTIPFIRSGEIHLTSTALFISESGLTNSSAKLVDKGDILFALYGATSGEVDISKINGAINQAILCIKPLSLNKYFLKDILEYQKQNILNKYLQGGQGNLSAEIIKSLKVLLPPLAEQEKIAEILGTWDEAIEKLSSLIEQKKLLKKGLMQKLLTGKVRLFKTSPLAGEVADLSASEGLDNNDNIKISSHRMYQPYIKEFSRDMRKNSTKAENLLWQKIRNGQLGFKFRRQHQIDNKYIADFICLEKRLIIELDGGQHNDRPKDKDRTLYLENNNFKVIRFWDNEILQNIDGCLEILLKEINLLNNPSPCPSPAMGEGISATYANSLPQGARKDAECSLDTPHLAQECHPLPQGARKYERFSQPWKKVKLGEITNKISDKNHENCSNVVTISAQNGFVNQDDFFNKFVSSSTLTDYYLLQKGDFGYNRSYSKGYPLGAIKKLNNHKKAVVSTLYICFRSLKDKINSVFLEQYFEIGLLNKELYKVAQEGARNHGLLNITLKDFFSVKLYIPSDISEQQAIADVLSTADDGIDLLNKKLMLFKEQKKGLMQQLLTGNIRVKVN